MNIKEFAEALNEFDLAPVIHARWKYNNALFDSWACTNCGFETDRTSKFCPNCGAKMDKED